MDWGEFSMKHVRGMSVMMGCAALALCGTALAKDDAALVITPKKGVAAARFGPVTVATADASWYYNWRNSPNSGTVPAGVTAPEYVPMLSNAGAVTAANISALTTAKSNGAYKYLLGFNEPDLSSQANMTVTQAIGLWPQLIATGLTLGSPAPSWPNAWFDTFMTQASAHNYRVDFISLHYYAPPNTATSVSDLKTFLTNAYNKYKKPIWLTEFGAPDCKALGWCGSNAAALTQAQVDAFVPQVIAMLEDLSFVQRYAWFVDASQSGFELSAVFNSDGSLTQTGIDLRDAHGTAAAQTFGGKGSAALPFQCVRIRPDGRIAFNLPAGQTGYLLRFFDASGRLAALCAGTGSGEVTLGRAGEKLTSGIYAARLEYNGQARQARVVVE
jgi:hypothetical protein